MTALAIKSDGENQPELPRLANEPRVERLVPGRESETLDFLRSRPSHTAYMAGLIHRNGLESPDNRGTFYAYTNGLNQIEGVALVGHAVTFEAVSDEAVVSLARLASSYQGSALMRGETNKIDLFSKYYEEAGYRIGSDCEERLLELTIPIGSADPDCDLRPATAEELDRAVEMNLDLIAAERGVDGPPLELSGLRQRLLQRIKNQQVWTWVCKGEMIFKTEIIARTPEVMYIEGVFVSSHHRGKGFGFRALSQLSRILLGEVKRLCVFVNAANPTAVSLYEKVGYQAIGNYKTIYFRK